MTAPDAFSLSEGAVFHDQYEVVRRIDSGAMGTVYEVLDRRTKRRRALKVMLTRFVDNTDVMERFRREATITADIVSEHVVETFDAGVDRGSGLPFLVMELLRGEDLGKVVLRGPLPRGEIVTLLMQAASALDKMHGAGIIHRDLKPENLFITRRDDGTPRLKILDFGIAKVVEKAAPSATSTRNMGTPVYMSPEQVMGSGNVGPLADLYALGHLAYAMLTGAPYWLEDALAYETVYPLLLRIMEGATEPASVRAARTHDLTLPPEFDAWFAKATAHAPEDRFKTATESIFALARALEVPRAMLASWPLDSAMATAPTLAPPASLADPHGGASTAETADTEKPLLLLSSAKKAPPSRRDEAVRTLSPVSTLPDAAPVVPAPAPAPSYNRAAIWLGSAFFAVGVIVALLLVRKAPVGASATAPTARLGESETITTAPPLSASSAAVLVAPPIASATPVASEPASSSSSAAAPSTAPLPSSTVTATARPAPVKRPSAPPRDPSAKPTAKPARPYGDPSRDL